MHSVIFPSITFFCTEPLMPKGSSLGWRQVLPGLCKLNKPFGAWVFLFFIEPE